ncbi:MAG: MBL fold metallo-hydrolase [bacterium]
MKVKFWGTRGSIPTPGPSTVKYGGNTTCLEIRTDDDKLFIVDAGTGIRELGLSLLGKGQIEANVFISHTHWDHIHGWPFFIPAFIPGNSFTIYGPVHYDQKLEEIISGQMHYSYFPVKLEHMASKISFVELKETTFELEGVHVTAKYLHHPILVLGYRFEQNGKTVVTMFDHEKYSNIFVQKEKKEEKDDLDDLLFGSSEDDENAEKEAGEAVEEMNRRVVEFARNADLAIVDAQYTDEEYPSKIGWGHGTMEDAIKLAANANIRRVALIHHEPTRPDEAMEKIEDFCAGEILKRGMSGKHEVFAAREKFEVEI